MTPDRPSDPDPRELTLSAGPAAYTDEGEGSVLLCVHGLPGSHRDFRWLAPALPGCRVLRVALPGFGGTARIPTPGTVELAAHVRGVADALGLSRYAVAGHSFGGAVATAVAASDPRVSHLALLASIGPKVHRGYRFMTRRQWTALALTLRTPGRALLLPKLKAGFVKAGFPRSTPDHELLWTIECASRVRFREHGARLAQVEVPTLIAWTDDDPLVEPAIAHAIDALVPAGPRLRFDDGGHNLQKTRAVEIGAALEAWLGEA